MQQGVDVGDMTETLLRKRGRLTRWRMHTEPTIVNEEWKRHWVYPKRIYKLECWWVHLEKEGMKLKLP